MDDLTTQSLSSPTDSIGQMTQPTSQSVGSATPANQADDPTSSSDILDQDLFELMGVKNLPEEKKQLLYQKMLDTIQNRVIARVGDQLSVEDLKQFQALAETGDQQKMADFLKSRGLDLAQLMLQEALLYKAEMVELAKPIKQASQRS